LAKPFIVSCPSDNPTFPVRAYPALAVTSTGPFVTGSTVTVSTPGYVLQAAHGPGQLYASFASASGPVYAPLTRLANPTEYSITIPAGVAGQNYLRFSNCNDTTALSADQIIAGPAVIEVSQRNAP
jgi:hypothetical protein